MEFILDLKKQIHIWRVVFAIRIQVWFGLDLGWYYIKKRKEWGDWSEKWSEDKTMERDGRRYQMELRRISCLGFSVRWFNKKEREIWESVAARFLEISSISSEFSWWISSKSIKVYINIVWKRDFTLPEAMHEQNWNSNFRNHFLTSTPDCVRKMRMECQKPSIVDRQEMDFNSFFLSNMTVKQTRPCSQLFLAKCIWPYMSIDAFVFILGSNVVFPAGRWKVKVFMSCFTTYLIILFWIDLLLKSFQFLDQMKKSCCYPVLIHFALFLLQVDRRASGNFFVYQHSLPLCLSFDDFSVFNFYVSFKHLIFICSVISPVYPFDCSVK